MGCVCVCTRARMMCVWGRMHGACVCVLCVLYMVRMYVSYHTDPWVPSQTY